MEEKKLSTVLLGKMDIMDKKLDTLYNLTGAVGKLVQNGQNGQGQNVVNRNRCPIIKNMTDAQARELLKQGFMPAEVCLISGRKLTVEYLSDMLMKMK